MVSHAGRRRRRRRQAVTAVLLVSLAGLAGMTALWRRSEVHARRLEARRLYDLARQMIARSPPVALAYAAASLEVMDSPEVRRLTLEALWSSPMPLVVDLDGESFPSSGTGVELSPDGRFMVTGHFDGHLALWSSSGGPPVVWRAHQDRARASFTPDSRTLLSGSAIDPYLIAWSIPEARRLGEQPLSGLVERSDVDARHANIWRRLWRRVRDSSVPGG
jgi:hypothetical protein